MKLAFCPKCEDIFKLISGKRTCKCESSSGGIGKDGEAWISGLSVPIGLDNLSLAENIMSTEDNRGSTVNAFFIGSAVNCRVDQDRLDREERLKYITELNSKFIKYRKSENKIRDKLVQNIIENSGDFDVDSIRKI